MAARDVGAVSWRVFRDTTRAAHRVRQMKSLPVPTNQRRRREIIEPTLEVSDAKPGRVGKLQQERDAPAGRHMIWDRFGGFRAHSFIVGCDSRKEAIIYSKRKIVRGSTFVTRRAGK
jgi:hypothetical protein